MKREFILTGKRAEAVADMVGLPKSIAMVVGVKVEKVSNVIRYEVESVSHLGRRASILRTNSYYFLKK